MPAAPLSPARALELLAEGSPAARWVRLAMLAAGLERADRMLDLADRSGAAEAAKGPYDVIWCGGRLTGTNSPERETLLQALEQRLAPGGVVVFTIAGTTTAEVCEQLAAAVPDLDLLLYQQGADGGEDVVACRKRPA